MLLEKYLKSIAKSSAGGEALVSETAFYTPLKNHILCGLLDYPPASVLITPSGKKTASKSAKQQKTGIPDLQIIAADKSAWIVGEAKLRDDDIRDPKKQERLWQDKMVERHYIGPETFYVLLVAPRTFYLYNVRRELQAGIHIENNELVDCRTNERHEATDANFRRLFSLASYQDSESQPQLRLFRKGELASGYIPITGETLPLLEQAFTKSIDELKFFCKTYFETLQVQYQKYSEQKAELEVQIENAGGDNRSRRFLREKLYRLNFKHRVHRQLFEHDYPNFEEAQAYSGTESKKDFQDVFITNTAYIALSRLIFVRLAEDIGLTEKRISNAGMAVWKTVMDELRHYQDIIDFTFKQVEHLYNRLFEESAFDWYGKGNGELSRILERILFRLNAFSFNNVNRDILGTMYQSFRPRIERKRLGEYYTADAVVDFILKQTGITTDPLLLSKKILDPACGSFTFGVRATLPILEKAAQLSAENKLKAVREALYGADINAFSVFLSHLSLFFVTLDLYTQARKQNPSYRVSGFNLFTQNSLIDLHTTQIETREHSVDGDESVSMPLKFDYIVGNPPFVRSQRMPNDDRDALKYNYPDIWQKNPELSAFFVYAMLKYSLKEDGTLGFVLPIGIANSGYGESLRKYLFNELEFPQLFKYTITQIVSLEWMAKDVFPDADIIPMLLFVKKMSPPQNHKVKITTGLRSIAELKQALDDNSFLASRTAEIPYEDFKSLSPVREWCIEVTNDDLEIVKKMNSRPKLDKIAKASIALEVGKGEAAISKGLMKTGGNNSFAVFGTGQNILSFGIDGTSEFFDLSKINSVANPSIWRYFDVKEKTDQHENTLGLSDSTFKPSDEMVCAIPKVATTLNASVFLPFEKVFNNSCLVCLPLNYTAHTVCAIINSLPSRYFAFMTLRSSILLRKRTTWVPRTINNLPLPDLTEETAKALHDLSVEAHQISISASLTPEDKFLELREKSANIKAGFLGVTWQLPDGSEATGEELIDKDELESAQIEGGELRLQSIRYSAPSEPVLKLLLMAMRAEAAEEFRVDSVQDILLPKEHHAEMIKSIDEVAENVRTAKDRMAAVTDRIDELVAEGLGIPGELETLRQRCREFPLSETVLKPRFVWSTDRKRQARRIYDKGDRYKS